MPEQLYPLKFKPILKEKIWGGEKLSTHLNKNSELKNIGESWEISDVKGEPSIVENGALKGWSLKKLLEFYKADLIGEKNYKIFKNKFPLLIKFIDAKEDLSIQLHPNDALAKTRHNSFGKTEMWYVIQAEEGSGLIVDFNKKITTKEYLEHVENKTLPTILNFDKVKTGDAYFIEGGRIHAIGAGVMLAEIQQTSDITYRVYDWGRVDKNGNSRALHNDLAIDAINFNMKKDFRVNYSKTENKLTELVNCNYFTTNCLPLTSDFEKANTKDSFLIYMCVEGEAEIVSSAPVVNLRKGDTVLIPAALKHFKIKTKNATLLEVYV